MIVTLPIYLKDSIDIAVSQVSGNNRIMTDSARYFFYRTISDSIRLRGLPGCFIDYDQKMLRSMLGRNDKQLVQSFEDNGLIAVDRTAIPGLQSYSYQVDSTFLDDQYQSMLVPKGYDDSLEKSTAQILGDCTIDETAALQEIKSFVNSQELIDSVLRDDQIRRTTIPRVRLYSNKYQRFRRDDLTHIDTDVLLNNFATPGFSLIKHDKKYYYMPWDMFVRMRRQAVQFSYNDALSRMLHGDIHTSRDEKGNRLHSNITNMPSRLLPYINYDGQHFWEIDLSNAQWCFLVYSLENQWLDNIISKGISSYDFDFNSRDYKDFKCATGNGTLYEWFKEELALGSRDEAKVMLFEILFGTRRRSDSKEQLRKLIPTIVDYLEYLKVKHGYKTIPCTLQQTEANVIVDTILYELHKNHIPALSKHDSILLPEDYYPIGKRIVEDILDKTLGYYNTKEKSLTP